MSKGDKTQAKRTYPWHHRRRKLLVLGLLCAVLLLVFASVRVRQGRQVDAQLEAIRAAGYPVSEAELDAWRPEGQPGSEVSEIPVLRESRAVIPETVLATGEDFDRAFTRYSVLNPPCSPVDDESRAAARRLLTENAGLLDELHRLANDPAPLSLAVVEYRAVGPEQGYETSASYLYYRAGVWLKLEAAFAAGEGDVQAAVDATLAMVRHARRQRYLPSLNEQFNRATNTLQACHALQRILCAEGLTPDHLKLLQREFQAAHVPEALRWTLIGLRAEYLDFVGNLDPKSVDYIVDRDPVLKWVPGRERTCLFVAETIGWNDLDRRNTLALFERMLAACELPPVQALPRLRAIRNDTSKLLHGWRSTPGIASDTCHLAEYLAQTGALLTCATTALAIERQRRAKGALPKTLDALDPAYQTAPPTDPFTGNPLRYQRDKETGGYLLYSLGSDYADQGGHHTEDVPFRVGR